MKPSLKSTLYDADRDQILDILLALSNKFPNLDQEIEFMLDPRAIKYPQSYYNKLVKRTIDTNSWSHFPAKGVRGLEEMLIKADKLSKIGNHTESEKLKQAIADVVTRTKRHYNQQHKDELNQILIKALK